jgi:hypothetical protein
MIANCLFTKLIWQRVKSWSGLDSTACPRVTFPAGDTGGGQTLGAARPFFLLSRLLGWQQRVSLSLSLVLGGVRCSRPAGALARAAWGSLGLPVAAAAAPASAYAGSGRQR